ncbi:MAG: ATP-binding cassette domain-containing protein, partial [Geminicoccales bacterium]
MLWAPEGLAGLVDLWRGVSEPNLQPSTPVERLSPFTRSQRLVLDKVVKRFGGVEALAGVSLGIGRGEIVGLIGPNGSGKTTLLNMVNGLERVDGGTIALDGRHLEHLPAHA